jgi:quaternary ammonium compound-resistance protein SugE
MASLSGWTLLLLAGLSEVFFASSIARTDGFTRPWPSLYCALFFSLSIYLLSLAVRELPLGLSYAVWVGIGTLGTAIYAKLFLGESIDVLRGLCLLMIIAGIVGLKVFSPQH